MFRHGIFAGLGAASAWMDTQGVSMLVGGTVKSVAVAITQKVTS